MVLADTGEAEIASCTCGYAADTEAAQATPHPVAYAAGALTKLETRACTPSRSSPRSWALPKTRA